MPRATSNGCRLNGTSHYMHTVFCGMVSNGLGLGAGKMNKRKDECGFCKRRSCYWRVVNENYDNIACARHIDALHCHANEALGKNNGVARCNISSTAKLRRGDKYEMMEL